MRCGFCNKSCVSLDLSLSCRTTRIISSRRGSSHSAVLCSSMSQEQTKQKILICGGGIIGTSIAYYLSERGVASTIIEKRRVAGAASGKAAGFLAADWNKHTHVSDLSELSFSLHKKLAQRFGDKIDFRHVDVLGLASTENTIPRIKTTLPSWIDGSILGSQVLGNEETCAQVHPYKLTHALLEAAMEKGVEVVYGSVEDIEWTDLGEKSKTAKGVLVDGELVAADVVVLAMGPWTKQASQWIPVPPVSAHKYHSIVLKPKQEVSAHVIFLNHLTADSTSTLSLTSKLKECLLGKQMDPEIYPRPNGEVYISGEAQPLTIPEDPEDVNVDLALCQNLHHATSSISSALQQSEVKTRQSCFLPLSPDGVPIIGKVPQTQNVFIATGHSCWGILNAPATGLIISEMIIDGKCSSLDATEFDPLRFTSSRT